ncbi:hypothetical protein CRT60_08660 [Azospirillum palustre]|uniref:Excisionase n=1 Tax=Azospirillum palustre TaxID=2044885 RepID=A0A2B8BJW5_9PROT|nr:hypothetical protein [Azospirillum palustre]PGH58019.1 hypothetical protein CRT60_08660 [Azospirillum palustre]
MKARKTMTPLKDWCDANSVPYSTARFYLANKPEMMPETIMVGRRHFITEEADTEFRARRLEATRSERARRAETSAVAGMAA